MANQYPEGLVRELAAGVVISEDSGVPAPAKRLLSMRIRILSNSTSVVLAGLISLPLAAFAQTKSTTPPLAGSKFVGVWQFSKDLSTPSPDTQSTTPTQGTSGRRGGRSGGGGGFGGRGGRGGGGGYGGGGGRGGGSTDQTQMLQARKFMTEVMTPPETVTIIADDTTVTFTDDHGVVRKYTNNGKKEKVDIGGPKIDATTKWNGVSLTQDLSIGETKVTETYTLSDDGNQLTEIISMNGGGQYGSRPSGSSGQAGQPASRQIRHVFTRSTV